MMSWHLPYTRLTTTDSLLTLVWLVSLAAPIVVLLAAFNVAQSSGATMHEATITGVFMASSTFVFGVVAGIRRQWKNAVPILFYGTAVIMACYLLSWSIVQPSDPSADNEAAVGVVILTLPVAFTLGIVLATGGAVGLLARKLLDRHKSRLFVR